MKRMLGLVSTISLLLAASGVGSTQYVFPAKGQSPEQQEKDEYECHQWAVGQTGYDPVKAASSTQTVTTTVDAGAAPGSGARGAVRGAAGGAIIANIAGGSGSTGAAAGAVIGGVRGRATSRQQAVVQEQVPATDPVRDAEYKKAKEACLVGKGYTVK